MKLLLYFLLAATAHAQLSAIYLGADADKVGTTGLAPDGQLDWHVKISGLKSVPVGYRITKVGTGCAWTFPANGKDWVIAAATQVPNADLWFGTASVCSGGAYNVAVKYSDGTTDSVDTSLPTPTPSVTPSSYRFNIVDQNGKVIGTGTVTLNK